MNTVEHAGKDILLLVQDIYFTIQGIKIRKWIYGMGKNVLEFARTPYKFEAKDMFSCLSSSN